MSRDGDLILYSTQELTHCDAMHRFVDYCLDALDYLVAAASFLEAEVTLFRGEDEACVDILIGSN